MIVRPAIGRKSKQTPTGTCRDVAHSSWRHELCSSALRSATLPVRRGRRWGWRALQTTLWWNHTRGGDPSIWCLHCCARSSFVCARMSAQSTWLKFSTKSFLQNLLEVFLFYFFFFLLRTVQPGRAERHACSNRRLEGRVCRWYQPRSQWTTPMTDEQTNRSAATQSRQLNALSFPSDHKRTCVTCICVCKK